MTRIGLIFGGRSVEHQVSVRSARTVAQALTDAGYEVIPLGIAPDGCWTDGATAAAALAGEMDDLPPIGEPVVTTLKHLISADAEVLFPIIHGTWGEDGTLQGLCEMLDLPYVGTGVTSSAVAMDKLFAKLLLQAARIPVVDFEAVERQEFEQQPDAVLKRVARFEPPVFVKPSVGGSSVGISKVDARADLGAAIEHALGFDDRLVVERGIVGRELECSVLGYGELEASAIGEIVPGKEFYDYADKYLDDGARLIAPADLPETVAARLRELAVAAFAALGCWGMARVDFLMEPPDRLPLNELNTLPGFTTISMYPHLWEISGLPIAGLVDRLVRIAEERHRDRTRLDRGIKTWIAELQARPG